MDFTKALAAKTIKERNELIGEEVESYADWDLDECTAQAGWAELDVAENITVSDRPDGLIIIVRGTLFGNEISSSGCRDIPRTDELAVDFEIRIDSTTGEYDEPKLSIGYDSDDEEENYFYAGDYV